MKKLSILLFLVVLFTACKKRNVVVYTCTCTWVRATVPKDTGNTSTFTFMSKADAQDACNNQKVHIPLTTDVKDTVTCNLF